MELGQKFRIAIDRSTPWGAAVVDATGALDKGKSIQMPVEGIAAKTAHSYHSTQQRCWALSLQG